jgi:hypothetical protein
MRIDIYIETLKKHKIYVVSAQSKRKGKANIKNTVLRNASPYLFFFWLISSWAENIE